MNLNEKFVDSPNLPKFKVKKVIVAGLRSDIYNNLKKLKIDTINIMPCPNLYKLESTHADMQCHHLNKNEIVISRDNTYLYKQLKNLGLDIKYSNKYLRKNYPYCSILNAARVNNYLFANAKYIDNTILENCLKNNIEIINVSQGYTKCSIAIIDSNSIITADDSIYKAAKIKNIDVLKIRPGYIELPGYNYGFIGGTCGLIDKNKIVFTGNILLHPDYKKIKNFIEGKNIEIICLNNKHLLDVGGILPITEQSLSGPR